MWFARFAKSNFMRNCNQYMLATVLTEFRPMDCHWHIGQKAVMHSDGRKLRATHKTCLTLRGREVVATEERTEMVRQ